MPRSSLNPTTAQRRTVSIAAGAGVSHAEIALALGVSRNTLERYFFVELLAGAARRRIEICIGVYEAAIRGSVTAARWYLRREPQ